VKILTLGQGSPDWIAWRRGGIGGSDAPVIMGTAPKEWSTREQLLEEKVTGKRRDTDFAMRRGTRLEPLVRELYAREVGLRVEPVCVAHSEVDWLLASLDGLCCADSGEWIAEIKCPNWMDHDTALAGIVPAKYVPQVQHCLFVADVTRCDYVSYSENQRFAERDRMVVVRVGADAEYQAALIEAEEAFWAEVCAARADARRKAVVA
jgi:putative phage-type endonuclease